MHSFIIFSLSETQALGLLVVGFALLKVEARFSSIDSFNYFYYVIWLFI